jgi:hypothetical protein
MVRRPVGPRVTGRNYPLVTSVENRLRELEYQIAFERFRLDYVLAAQEGILREA